MSRFHMFHIRHAFSKCINSTSVPAGINGQRLSLSSSAYIFSYNEAHRSTTETDKIRGVLERRTRKSTKQLHDSGGILLTLYDNPSAKTFAARQN